MTHRLLVTGGQGFVGRALAAGALAKGFSVRVSSRQKLAGSESRLEFSQVGSLGSTTDWLAALQGVEAVVHCAGRAHVMQDAAADPLSAFRTVNLDGTLNLARQAVEAGVKRFVFISSIGVNGAQTMLGKPFSETEKPNPHNAYALSKWEAEQGLLRVADETELEVVIIRPPLVYGFDAPGNFGSLMRAVQRGWPLPLGAVHNQRSLVYVGNLVDAIITCLEHPAATGQTYLVSDGDDVSTSELIRRIAISLGRSARLLPLSPALLRLAGLLTGKSAQVERLLDSLVIDSSKIRRELGWRPPFTMAQGLAETAKWFQGSGDRA